MAFSFYLYLSILLDLQLLFSHLEVITGLAQSTVNLPLDMYDISHLQADCLAPVIHSYRLQDYFTLTGLQPKPCVQHL